MKSEQYRFRRNVLLLLFGALSVSLFSANSMGQSLTPRSIAFDGAEGFGKFSRGGAEGKLYIVTSLEDKDEPEPYVTQLIKSILALLHLLCLG